MSEDLHAFLVRELRTASAGTDDCPTMLDRVSAGVARRRRRRQALAAALVLVAVGTATPVLTAGSGGRQQAEAGGCQASVCDGATVARAQLALRRANPTTAVSEAEALSRTAADEQSCADRPYCRGPV